MNTPFDQTVDDIRMRGFHNHRLEDHSATVSRGILCDLRATCEPFQQDFAAGIIREWLDFPSPGGRSRKLDLVVAEPGEEASGSDLARLRRQEESGTTHRGVVDREQEDKGVPR